MRAVFLLAGLALPFAATTAQAFGSCTDPGYVESFPGSFAAANCEERARFTLSHGLGRSEVRVVSFTSDAHGDDAAWIARVERNLAGIGEALRSMGRVGTGDITVLLAGAPADEGWEGEATLVAAGRRPRSEECAVTLYKIPSGYDERHFDFLFAHELFHCAQFRSFPGASGAANDWWLEGSAEHFAHMAVPDAGDFGWYRAFDSRSADEPLTALSYENVVFFHWLQMREGPEGVAAFLSAMPGDGDQTAALRSRLDTAGMVDFTEAYLEGRITAPGGSGVPGPDYFTGDYVVGDTVDLPISVTPFVPQRYRVKFDREKHYEVRVLGAEGADVRMQDEGGAWSNLPITVSTCPDEVTRLSYAVTADAATSGTVQFVKDEVEGAGACCLEGEWEATEATLAGLATLGTEIGGPALAAAGVSMSCSYEGGGAGLVFRADGTGALTFDGHSTSCVARAQGQAMSTTGTRNGSFEFDWTTKSADAGMASYTDNSVIWTMDIRLGPVVQSMSNPDAGPSTEANGFAFSCTETTLDILGIYGLSHKENRFTRPPPAP